MDFTLHRFDYRYHNQLENTAGNASLKKVGGAHAGAGLKVGSVKFQEPTSVMRVPVCQKLVISDFLAAYARKQQDSTTKFDVDAVELHLKFERAPP